MPSRAFDLLAVVSIAVPLWLLLELAVQRRRRGRP